MSEEKKRFKKVKYVTRTFNNTKVTTLCMNVETAEPETSVFELEGTFNDEKKLLEKVRELHETETFKVVTITSTEPQIVILGVPSDKFMEIAIELDPETRQAYDREEY